jgi:sugar/nucleoside kinase (ribokinase family)
MEPVGAFRRKVAGFLYGLLTADVPAAVRYGNAFSALKQTSWGDLSYAALEEVESPLKGGSSRIVR